MEKICSVFLFCVLSACVISLSIPNERKGYSVDPFTFNSDDVSKWMVSRGLEPISESDRPSKAFVKAIQALKTYASEIVAESKKTKVSEDQMLVDQSAKDNRKKSQENDYPFWQFMPYDFGMVRPGAAPVTWTGMCFRNSSAISILNSDGSVDLELTLENPKDLLCSDFFLIGSVEQFSLQEVFTSGKKLIKFTPAADARAAQKWDLQTNGLRVFMFEHGVADVMASVTATAELFEPLASKGVLNLAAEKNIKFLKNYANIDMKKRTTTDVILDKSQIQSGDFFGIIRLDGLDPMLAWAMGSTTGHTTVALWGEDGELYICESTATTSYWDVNGIQKTPYTEWLKKAKEAGFNVVHIPLAPEYRAKMNLTAAWEFFNNTEGIDYGYDNMLWGWVDTLKDNYPCAPPNYDRCLSWNVIVVAFPQVEKIVKQFTSFYFQAWNFRLGTSNLPMAELLYEAHQQNIVPDSIPAMVEDDTWMYNTTRNGVAAVGPSMVCCVFVCHIWKASGVFSGIDNVVNCGELTNWDDYALTLFDKNYVRPQACVDADPDNQVCQLLGEYSVNLNNYNSKDPYQHMAEKCPSLAPNYNKPSNC
eukprot:c20540_g1_i1.p1 GENE.c20540_g1_i1~~c20540_g1_i1.p1  ORF type:complete len:590 (-),score=239.66 c20540_g1_i1:109-1878(-)